MIELEIKKSDLEALRTKLASLQPVRQDTILWKAFVQAGLLVARKLKDNVTNGILNRRTGHLAQSIGFYGEVKSGEGFTGRAGSGYGSVQRLPYAEIHETGGVITPKHSKYLTIPLEAALTPSGVAKKASAREWKNTFVGKSKAGNLIIFQKVGVRNPKLIPLYVLKKSVKIPERQYMSVTAQQMSNRFMMAMRGAVERSLTQ